MTNRTMTFLSPTAPGSLGDQAMLDASTTYVTQNLGYAARVVPHAPALRSGARVIKGQGIGALAAAGRSILRSDCVVCIGADVLDGVYSARSSLKRLRALYGAHLLSRRTRILGSSWSETPAPEVISFLKKATWLEVKARDPVSQARMERDLERDVGLVADLAFLLKPEVTTPSVAKVMTWIAEVKDKGATVLAVNPSGHTIKKLKDQSPKPLIDLVARWLDADPLRRVVLMPHDTRGGLTGDVMAAARMAEALSASHGDRVTEIKAPLEVWDAKAVAGAVDVVLTGRMHFAIGALGMGTPPVSIVYQGKFEGLMQHFDLTDAQLTIAPEELDASVADDRLARATAERKDLSERIRAALPRIGDLSRANFDGL